MHKHQKEHHHAPTNESTARRIGLLSLWNLAFGSTVVYAGSKLGSPIIQMQGIHDALDGGLNAIKYIAAKQKNTIKEIAWRKVAVLALGTSAVTFGGYELFQELQHPAEPDRYSVPAAYAALGANVLGAGLLLGVKSNQKSKDAITHAVLFDLPASFVTVATTHLEKMSSLGSIAQTAETGGILVHMGLAAYAVTHTMQDIHDSAVIDQI